jgi:hypothetical protein
MSSSQTQSKSAKKKNDQNNGSGSSSAQGDMGTSVNEAVDQVQGTVTGLKDQVMQQASNQLTSRLESVTGSLDMAVKLLRTAGDTVREQEKTGVADSITGVADRLEGWSSSIRDQDVDKIIAETKQMAQKQPVLFVSGAVALGFIGARFLRSSAAKQQDEMSSSSSGSDDSSPSAPSDGSTSSSPASSDTSGASVGAMSSLPADSEIENTNPYPSYEENAAIDASLDAPVGSDESAMFEDEIIVPEFDDSPLGTTGSRTSTEGR